MNDNLHFNSQAKLQAGIAKVAQAVGKTMGTAGSNVIIEALENPGYLATNDGYSVANAIILKDPQEDMGRKILLEAINRANKASGDGSSTTCVLTAALIEEGTKTGGVVLVPKGEDPAKYKPKQPHPMDIKRDLEASLKTIEESLEAQTTFIVKDGQIDMDRLRQVATISAEDEQIGNTIADIYQEIGPKGLVYWDVSKTSEDSYKIGSGITVEGAGFASPYMCDATETGANTNQIRLKNPKILITKQKLVSAADFNTLAATLDAKEVKDLIVFCDEFEPLMVTDLVKTRMLRGFRIALVKMPTLWKDWWYEDLALATGATVIDPTAGLPMKAATLEHLGTVGNIIVTKDDTYLDGIKDVTEHIKALEEEQTDDTDLRASRLNTKTARYFVGAHSESALSYRRLKVEDAIGAAYQALNGGIVPGGGIALYNASKLVDNSILQEALKAPFYTILKNIGLTEYSGEVGGTLGINTRTREVVDMMDEGIVDPANVTLNAVRNAISVAATVLTAPTLITLPREEVNPVHPNLIVK